MDHKEDCDDPEHRKMAQVGLTSLAKALAQSVTESMPRDAAEHTGCFIVFLDRHHAVVGSAGTMSKEELREFCRRTLDLTAANPEAN